MSTDDRLQDFLDDRLAEDERRAFEARIAREPELARRLAEHRALRAALREEEPLPPGFHTRARAAFESSRGRSRRGGRFGLMRWEAVGLAAAAGLALFLFGPDLLRDDLPTRPRQEPAALRQAPFADESVPPDLDDDRGPTAGEAVKAKDNAASADSLDSLERLEKQQMAAPAAADRPAAPEADAKKVAERAETDAAASGRESKEAAAEAAPPRRDRLATGGYAPAPPPATATPPAEPAPQVAASEYREDEPRLQRAEADRPGARKAAGEAETLGGVVASVAARAMPVPSDAVAGHSVASVVDPEVLARLTGAAGKSEIGKLRDDEGAFAEQAASPLLRPGERAVVIGPRDRLFVCDGLRVVTTTTEHTIYLAAPAPGLPSGPTACAVFLPDDGRRIVVVDPP